MLESKKWFYQGMYGGLQYDNPGEMIGWLKANPDERGTYREAMFKLESDLREADQIVRADEVFDMIVAVMKGTK